MYETSIEEKSSLLPLTFFFQDWVHLLIYSFKTNKQNPTDSSFHLSPTWKSPQKAWNETSVKIPLKADDILKKDVTFQYRNSMSTAYKQTRLRELPQ